MQWHTPKDSKYYVFTNEGYTVSRMWIGATQSWLYTAWGPNIPVPENGNTRPNMLKCPLDTAIEAKRVCEEHFAEAQIAKVAQR